MIDRRRWLKVSAGILAGGWSAGCASRPEGTLRTPPPWTPLRPVRVSRDRVIRVVAGLRPYRAEGFVVRAERFAGKLLVHNYGHGGGGVTLSWGTAEMAADLVTYGGRTGDVGVVGAGAVGLATARLLQRRGRQVTIYARDLPPDTTSNIAGAQWSPSTVSDDLDGPFGHRYERAARLAYRHFQNLVGAGYGVRWIDNYFPRERPPGSGGYSRIRDLFPEWETLEGDEHPFPTRYVRRAATMFIEPHRYLRAVLTDFRVAGGRVVVGEIANLEQLAALAQPVIVNCTGMGARELFGDESLVPIKGQLVVLRPQPGIDYLTVGGGRFSTRGSQYMFPRSDGILLGGTYELGVETLEPDPGETERILADHAAFFGAMEGKVRGLGQGGQAQSSPMRRVTRGWRAVP